MQDILLGLGMGLILSAFFAAYSRIIWLNGFNNGYREARTTIRLD